MINTPKGIRIPVASVKGRCPRPLDDGGTSFVAFITLTNGAGICQFVVMGFCLGAIHGYGEMKTTAPSWFRFDPDASVVGLDNLPTDGQPQAITGLALPVV